MGRPQRALLMVQEPQYLAMEHHGIHLLQWVQLGEIHSCLYFHYQQAEPGVSHNHLDHPLKLPELVGPHIHQYPHHLLQVLVEIHNHLYRPLL